MTRGLCPQRVPMGQRNHSENDSKISMMRVFALKIYFFFPIMVYHRLLNIGPCCLSTIVVQLLSQA